LIDHDNFYFLRSLYRFLKNKPQKITRAALSFEKENFHQLPRRIISFGKINTYNKSRKEKVRAK
jgi:hypothetical protein